MVNLLLLPLMLFSFGGKQPNLKPNYQDYLNLSLNERGNYTLTSINEFSGDEFRVYRYSDKVIDEIDDNAFTDTTFKHLVFSNCVTHISQNCFTNASNITAVSYTGSKEEFDSLNISFNKVNYYAVDEGFINFWNKNIRPESGSNICSISKDTYSYVKSLYDNLSKEDLETVNQYTDLANAKIADSMKELNNVFDSTPQAKKNDEWNQTGAITLIIVVAVIGMTSITIFYLLKTKKIID